MIGAEGFNVLDSSRRTLSGFQVLSVTDPGAPLPDFDAIAWNAGQSRPVGADGFEVLGSPRPVPVRTVAHARLIADRYMRAFRRMVTVPPTAPGFQRVAAHRLYTHCLKRWVVDTPDALAAKVIP